MTEEKIDRMLYWAGLILQQMFLMGAWALAWAWTGSFWKALAILVLAAVGGAFGAAVDQFRKSA